MSGKAQQIQGLAKRPSRPNGVDGRTRNVKQFNRLVAEWTAALPPTPVGTRIRANSEVGGTPFAKKDSGGKGGAQAKEADALASIDPIRGALIERGCALEMRVREIEADFLAGREIESGKYQRLVSTLVGIQRSLGLIPRSGNVSPQSKPKAKPGPKVSTLSPHAKAVLKAVGGSE